MKKNLAILLVVATLFTCLLGFSASAAPSYKIAMVTVPMRATLSILFAVEVDDYGTLETGEPASPRVAIYESIESNSRQHYLNTIGVYTDEGGKSYWIYEFELPAADMEKQIKADVVGQRGLHEIFSAADYLRAYIKTRPEGDAYAKLAQKMIDLGKAASDYNEAKAAAAN